MLKYYIISVTVAIPFMLGMIQQSRKTLKDKLPKQFIASIIAATISAIIWPLLIPYDLGRMYAAFFGKVVD